MAAPPDDNRLGRAYAAPEITVFYDRSRCRHYAECVRGLPQVFDPARRPWIRADLADSDTVAEVVRRCPTGALHYRLPAEQPEEPPHPTIITPDPRGPLLVRGDLVLDTPEGPLAETRAALCACGRTRNQPFLTVPAASTAASLTAPGTRRRHPGALSQRPDRRHLHRHPARDRRRNEYRPGRRPTNRMASTVPTLTGRA